MFESLIGLVAIVALFVIISRQQARLNLMQREVAALRGMVLSTVPVSNAGAALAREVAAEALGDAGKSAETDATGQSPTSGALQASVGQAEETADGGLAPAGEGVSPLPSAPAAQADAAAPPLAAGDTPQPPRRDIETALGTRWAVWVGGIALALGGLFLVRYTIEAGIFGPGVRLAMAAVLGLALAGAGEFIRRTGFKVPVEGAAGAYIPAILTAAGAFILFGTVYAAHAVYGFIGPATAFALLGAIGMATLALALVHGLALAGIGLLGALAVPLLIETQSHSDWALFGYLAIVLAATAAIARIRAWKALMAGAFCGIGLWTLLYTGSAAQPDFRIILFIGAVSVAVLAAIWLAGRGEGEGDAGVDWPSIVPGVFVGLSAFALFVDPNFAPAGAAYAGTVLIALMLAAALWRPRGLPLLHAAGATTALAFLAVVPFASISFDGMGDYLPLGDLSAVPTHDPLSVVIDALMPRLGIVLGALFILGGFWSARRFVDGAGWRAAMWAGWGVAAPLVIVFSLWVTFGDIDRDAVAAAFAALLLALFVTGGEWLARAEAPPLAGGKAVCAALIGAGLAGLLFVHMAFGPGMTTVLLGAASLVPALATRWRAYPVLGWLCVGAAVAVLGRVAVDPTVVGAPFLSTMPVFNWLLPGYGIPALAFGVSAWQLARTTGGRPRLAMEAATALFAVLTVAMLVRHAMHGGVIDTGALTLAEQAIYTLIALGFSAILIAIDARAPSSVLRYGSIAVGIASAALIAVAHFGALNPLFTDESTGRIPVFNLLFLAYLLPAIAAGALALYARPKRPRWYVAMLALMAALLAFAYATLSVRRFFKGEFIGWWTGMGEIETYTYSALWLLLGVVLLVVGVRFRSHVLRVASAVLIAVAVLKVFIVDMSNLEGVLRALSFIGLGAVLIGIGLFYQRLLRRHPQEGAESVPASRE